MTTRPFFRARRRARLATSGDPESAHTSTASASRPPVDAATSRSGQPAPESLRAVARRKRRLTRRAGPLPQRRRPLVPQQVERLAERRRVGGPFENRGRLLGAQCRALGAGAEDGEGGPHQERPRLHAGSRDLLEKRLSRLQQDLLHAPPSSRPVPDRRVADKANRPSAGSGPVKSKRTTGARSTRP